MKAYLLYPDQDFDLNSPLPWNAEDLICDLELSILFLSMSQKDEFIYQVVEKVVLAGLVQEDTIFFRQEILKDCLAHPGAIRDLYALAVEAMELAKKLYYGILDRHPEWVLRRSVDHMEAFVGILKKLRSFANAHADRFAAAGWTEFFSRLDEEINDEYIEGIEAHLRQLRFPGGVLLSAGLGKGNKGSQYLLHRMPSARSRSWLLQILAWLGYSRPGKKPFSDRQGRQVFSFSLNPRDESGARALSELRSRGVGIAARALAQSVEHVRGFFGALQAELAFYIGCLNLHQQLAGRGEPVCFPSPEAMDARCLSFRGIYDICLALESGRKVIGNDVDACGKELLVITGANQGGKSTLLRSIGLAQLMMQCGMFAGSVEFRSSVCSSVLTHCKREEDTGMESGKLDEELGRMSGIVDRLLPHSLLLMNESFAATNEREGSEIAFQIISAVVENPTKVVCVTHLYELARRLFDENQGNILFLRAQREEDGARTFKLVEGEPLRTGFGGDLFENIFITPRNGK